MLKILIDNKDGNVWDISMLVADVSWKTSRIGKAGSLDFTLIKNALGQDKKFKYSNGDIVRVQRAEDGENVFYGYIFSIDGGRDEAVKISCYDQIRYLMANKTYILSNVTASEVIRKIAADFNLKLGQIDDTGYRIPVMSEDNQKLLDIICKALDLTLINSGKNYVFFDDFGSLSVRNIEDSLQDFFIGDGSFMTDYAQKTSIDSDTYNKINLYQDKKECGDFIDSANTAKWGILQLCQSVDGNLNRAQINEMLKNLVILKNRESKTLKIEAIGHLWVRAGRYVRIRIEEYGINQPFLVDECTHNFEGTNHTMSLELKVI
ncbi:XkdQ/YqbQ family protein [Desulfosporosinus fructosivorans]